ncbi:MAG TPA: deoxynucleoside kinase [bacterium]|nr:deoxynucleoside kinase [bacterium]
MAGKKRIIAVAGNMGSGKSSLVRFLCQQFQLTPFFEPNDRNPYIEDFYEDMKEYAFRSQIFFLIHRFRMHREMEGRPETVVQDRTIYEDAEIFAEYLHRRKLIDARDYRTYREMYETLVGELKPPDLLIYLQCSTKALMKRIERRGRKSEEGVPRNYVEKLNDLYDEWFARYNRSPTLVIESEKMDYIEDLFGRHDLLKTIEKYL